jgi:SOS-response transcriptional repressor LexA
MIYHNAMPKNTQRVNLSQEEISQNEKSELLAGFGERFLKAFGDIKQVEIANLLKVKPSAITNYTKDRIPKADILLKVWELTKCDLHWLLTGEHWHQPSLPASVPLEYKERKTIEDLAHTTGQTVEQTVRELLIEALENRGLMSRQSPTMLIFRHDMKLVALLLIGSISADQPIKYFEKQKQKQVMVAEAFIPPDHAGYQFCLLQIVGNDVAEGLRDGDYLICCDNRNPTSDSVVVALINGGSPVVKRIFFEGPNVRLQPYNNKSPGETYPAEQVEILYTVTGIQHNP